MAEYIKLEPRYIDINKFSIPKGFFNQDLNVPKIFDLLYSQPAADVVEVVRCRDCKHHHWEQEPCHGKTEHFCSVIKAQVFKDFYCYHGERRASK